MRTDDTDPVMKQALDAAKTQLRQQVRIRAAAETRIGQLQATVASLTAAVHGQRPPGTGEVIKGFLDRLQPGEDIDVAELVRYGRSVNWVSTSPEERTALIGRLSRWALEGRVARADSHRAGRYRKLTEEEQAAYEAAEEERLRNMPVVTRTRGSQGRPGGRYPSRHVST
jgi:hypothetical protein